MEYLIAGIILGLIIGYVIDEFFPEWTKAYKQGQIDYANGKIKYELTKNDDGEQTWSEIKGE